MAADSEESLSVESLRRREAEVSARGMDGRESGSASPFIRARSSGDGRTMMSAEGEEVSKIFDPVTERCFERMSRRPRCRDSYDAVSRTAGKGNTTKHNPKSNLLPGRRHREVKDALEHVDRESDKTGPGEEALFGATKVSRVRFARFLPGAGNDSRGDKWLTAEYQQSRHGLQDGCPNRKSGATWSVGTGRGNLIREGIGTCDLPGKQKEFSQAIEARRGA